MQWSPNDNNRTACSLKREKKDKSVTEASHMNWLAKYKSKQWDFELQKKLVARKSLDENCNIPPSWANLEFLTTYCALGVGNLTFVWVGWGKLNRKCKVSNDIFLANSNKRVFGREEEFKWRDLAIIKVTDCFFFYAVVNCNPEPYVPGK